MRDFIIQITLLYRSISPEVFFSRNSDWNLWREQINVKGLCVLFCICCCHMRCVTRKQTLRSVFSWRTSHKKWCSWDQWTFVKVTCQLEMWDDGNWHQKWHFPLTHHTAAEKKTFAPTWVPMEPQNTEWCDQNIWGLHYYCHKAHVIILELYILNLD